MNDTMIHFTSPYLPFGGVGNSGMGSYHGKYGFDNMSHIKPILDRKPQVMGLRYPPFTPKNQKTMKFLLNYANFTQRTAFRFLFTLGLLIMAFYFRGYIIQGVKNIFQFHN